MKSSNTCKCGKALTHPSQFVRGKCRECLAKLWIARVKKRR